MYRRRDIGNAINRDSQAWPCFGIPRSSHAFIAAFESGVKVYRNDSKQFSTSHCPCDNSATGLVTHESLLSASVQEPTPSDGCRKAKHRLNAVNSAKIMRLGEHFKACT